MRCTNLKYYCLRQKCHQLGDSGSFQFANGCDAETFSSISIESICGSAQVQYIRSHLVRETMHYTCTMLWTMTWSCATITVLWVFVFFSPYSKFTFGEKKHPHSLHFLHWFVRENPTLHKLFNKRQHVLESYSIVWFKESGSSIVPFQWWTTFTRFLRFPGLCHKMYC